MLSGFFQLPGKIEGGGVGGIFDPKEASLPKRRRWPVATCGNVTVVGVALSCIHIKDGGGLQTCSGTLRNQLLSQLIDFKR